MNLVRSETIIPLDRIILSKKMNDKINDYDPKLSSSFEIKDDNCFGLDDEKLRNIIRDMNSNDIFPPIDVIQVVTSKTYKAYIPPALRNKYGGKENIILVQPKYEVLNGRHRVVASIITGKSSINCNVFLMA